MNKEKRKAGEVEINEGRCGGIKSERFYGEQHCGRKDVSFWTAAFKLRRHTAAREEWRNVGLSTHQFIHMENTKKA